MSHPSACVMLLESAGIGGTETYVEELARHLMRTREVVIVTLDGDAAGAARRFPGIRCRSASGTAGFLGVLRSMPRSSVVCPHLYTSLLPAVLAAKIRGMRTVVTYHQPLRAWGLRHRLAWRASAALADGIVTVSSAAAADFGRAMRRVPTSVCPPPLQRCFAEAALPDRAPDDRPLVVAGAGRLSREKDWPTLLRAAARLETPVRVAIAGEGALRNDLTCMGRELGLDLDLPGALDRPALRAFLASADVFVHPARFEGFGLAPIEAMSTGLPTVTSQYAAARDYIREGVTGWTFPIGHHTALAERLVQLQADGDVRRRVGQTGARFVRETFPGDVTFDRFADLVERVAQEPPTPAPVLT